MPRAQGVANLEPTPAAPLRTPASWPRYAGITLEERDGMPYLAAPQVTAGHRLLVEAPLPGDLFREVYALDHTDGDAVLEFVNRCGFLGVSADGYAVLRLSDLKTVVPPGKGVNMALISRLASIRAGLRRHDFGEFLYEFQVGAAAIKSLVLCRRVATERLSERKLADEWPRYCPWSRPTGRGYATGARLLLLAGINAGVSGMHPRLLPGIEYTGIVGDLADLARDPTMPIAATLSGPGSLYGVCAMELFNNVAADRPFNYCVQCGAMFDLTRRLSTLTTRRKAAPRPAQAKFCTDWCGNAHRVAKHRAAKKADTAKGGSRGKHRQTRR